MELGNPILGNIKMIGAAAGIGALPIDRESFAAVIAATLSADKLDVNLQAYDLGVAMVQ
jgi:Pyruvate/2-oxoacid:ferredoxin oxidoreductase gamma subunit